MHSNEKTNVSCYCIIFIFNFKAAVIFVLAIWLNRFLSEAHIRAHFYITSK